MQTETPIIAVGGITLEDVSYIISIGIYGVAVSEAVTQNFNLIPTFHKILNAPSTNEQVYKLGDNN